MKLQRQLRVSEVAKLASKAAGKASETAGKASEPAERTSDPAKRASNPAWRASKPAASLRAKWEARWVALGACWKAEGGRKEKNENKMNGMICFY